MTLDLYREPSTEKTTIGRLAVNGVFANWTLEDVVRDGPKIAHETAIAPGTYRVIITYSTRFERMLPLLLGVPDFSSIRIHAGNTDADTSGCILVGQQRGDDAVWHSQAALDALLPKIATALAKAEPVAITIHPAVVTNPFGRTVSV